MDRNGSSIARKPAHASSLSARRAWIEIELGKEVTPNAKKSLSARRAWIEIRLACLALIRFGVALRKESVDRNLEFAVKMIANIASLSARRAWIEIKLCIFSKSVIISRSPQGERG